MYGEILRNLRIEKGLSQQQLADILGFKSASAVGMIERQEREVSVEKIIAIADYFNVSSDYLMGLVPFKNETEAYHSICVASVKYLQEHPDEIPVNFDEHAIFDEMYEDQADEELLAYCEQLILKYEKKLPLTDLELFELSNILFLTVKWSPEFNGIVYFEGFYRETFSIKLDFNEIEKITLDLSKSILVNFKSGTNTFVKYTSVLDTKSKDLDSFERVSDVPEDNQNNADTINRKIKDIELLEDFDDAEKALTFILSQPALAAYGGYDLKSMSDEEIIEIANDMLFAMRLSLEKLKRKHK